MAVPEVEDLYKFIAKFHENESFKPVESVEEDKLNVTLRPYQLEAVKWMLHREKYAHLEQFVFEGNIGFYNI